MGERNCKKELFYKGSYWHPCFWCGVFLAREDGTLDHLIPKCKGGKKRLYK